MEDGGAGRARGRELWVVLRDRRGDHDLGALGEVGGVVADDGVDAGVSELGAVARLRLVRARDGRAELLRHKRQTAHARAADPDEVEGAAGKRRIEGVGHGRLTISDRPAGPSVLPRGV